MTAQVTFEFIGYCVTALALWYFYSEANKVRKLKKGGYKNSFFEVFDTTVMHAIIFFGMFTLAPEPVTNTSYIVFGNSLPAYEVWGSIYMFVLHMYIWKKFAVIEAYRSINKNKKRINDIKSLSVALIATLSSVYYVEYYRLDSWLLMLLIDLSLVGSVVVYTTYLRNVVEKKFNSFSNPALSGIIGSFPAKTSLGNQGYYFLHFFCFKFKIG